MNTPYRIAVIGAGPAGFFATDALLQADLPVEIDIFDRLPVPFGLIRYGIAPDHPRIKAIAKIFEKILDRPEVAFFGNVNLGETISLDELRGCYDAVILAMGLSGHRSMNIPGESLPGSCSAPEIVGWYNGHPDFPDAPDLSGTTAVIVGNGNVALDIARMLARSADTLVTETDTPAPVIAALRNSKLRQIIIMGRRGPAQNAFGLGDLKEIGETPGCTARVRPADIELAPEDQVALTAEGRTLAQRKFDLLCGYAANTPPTDGREVLFRFCESPLAIEGDGRVERLRIVRNRMAGPPEDRRAIPTEEEYLLPCSLVIRCIGYHGIQIPAIPYHAATGTVPNFDGRVHDDKGAALPGLYAVGWLRRGPIGLVGVNKKDSIAVAQLILHDLVAQTPTGTSRESILQLLRARTQIVTTEDWRKIDSAEVAAGQRQGRPREKLCATLSLLAAKGD